MTGKFRLSMALLFGVLALEVPLAGAQDAVKDIHIAVVGPMTGPNSGLGRAMFDAVTLKAEQTNAAGGIKGRNVKVLSYDDQNSADVAVLKATEIAGNEDMYAVIGHRSSSSSIAAGPVYKSHGIPAITATATAEGVTKKNPWYFRIVYDNKLQASFIAHYMNHVLHFEHATLIHSTDLYSTSLAEAFRNEVDNLPMKLSREYTVEADESDDLGIEMLGIVSGLSISPDSGVVFLALQAPHAAIFLEEMRNSGFTFPIFGADSINDSFPSYFEKDDVLGISQGDFTDQVYTAAFMLWDVAGAAANKFRADFHDRFERDPDGSSAAYYDAATLVLRAIEASDTGTDIASDRKNIRDYLAKIDSLDKAFQGITGTIYFDDNGNAIKTVPIARFNKEAFVSAPVQLEPVVDPVRVPNFGDKRISGKIIAYQEGYAHATQIVYIGIDINEFSHLNTATGEYVLDFYIWFRYRGELDLEGIDFPNAVEKIPLRTPIWERERQGMRISTFKVRGKFRNQFEFQKYPFDKQEILLEVRHRDQTRESLTFVIDRIGMQLRGRDKTLLQRMQENEIFRSLPGWAMTNAVIYQDLVRTASTLGETVFYEGEAEVDYSRVNLLIDITRNLSSYSTTILLPLAVLFAISMLIYMIPVSELPARISAGVLVLVTVGLLRGRLSDDLPNIGYLVAIDYVFFLFQILMVMGIFVTIWSFWHFNGNKPDRARVINIWGAIAHPMPMVIGLIILWVALRLE